MSLKGYKKLLVWKKVDELAKAVYLVTKTFPSSELYGVTSQLRRSALSVAVNIAEGCGRQNRNELKHFSNIALGSLSEVEYLIDFSKDLGYLPEDKHLKLEELRTIVGKLLWGFYKSL